jgi:DGQHR domain-containing protein
MTQHGWISFPCIAVRQPIGQFYIGSMSSSDLVEISFADVRRIETEGREVEQYLGIQRPLSSQRVLELQEYVKNLDATFPTSIILAAKSEDAQYDDETRTMKIRRDNKVAKIIDGQHRIAGLENYNNGLFQLNVTLFVDMDIEDQAMVFATINLKQTKVNKSLAYDLYEFSKARSPQKTCHNIAKLLNSRSNSPLKDKIKILGVASGKSEESITQATFVDKLMNSISKDPMKDRDLLKRRKPLERAVGKEEMELFLRNLFIQDRDGEIARVLWNYFEAVKRKWPDAWPNARKGNILNRTTGFSALMRFLKNAYTSFDKRDAVIPIESFGRIFTKIRLADHDFTPERYKPGSSGEALLYRDLLQQAGLDNI